MQTPVPKVGPDMKSVSPSQIKEYRLCPSKWYLNKRCGIPQPEGDHLKVGTGGHAAQESYYETGTIYEPAAFASKYFPSPTQTEIRSKLETMLKSGRLLLKDPLVPKPKPGLLIETPRSYNTGLKLGGIALRQRSDLVDPTDATTAFDWDWKSSARVFSDYSKTGEQLMLDEQAILYGWEIFSKHKHDAVVFSHGIMGTNDVEYDVVQTDPMSRTYIAEQVSALDETVQEMRKVFAIDDFAKVPRKPSNAWGSPCRAFKGCPYASICGVDLSCTTSTPPPEEGSTTMTLKERLKAKQTATPAIGINPPDAAKPAPVTPYVPVEAAAPTPPPAGGFMADLKALIAKYEGAQS